jgi:hypothetical protein
VSGVVIANVIGGLGNQLFQYACGWAVARRLGVPLRICTRQFNGYRLHNGFELRRVFGVPEAEASNEDLVNCLGILRHDFLRQFVPRVAKRWAGVGRLVVEPTVTYWRGIEEVKVPAFLHGYWQTEKYFEEFAAELRGQLKFREPPTAANAMWLDRIASCESVGIHIRRGDYVSSAKNRAVYYSCPESYYFAAIDRILSAYAQARLFIFSDDPAWARERFAGLRCVEGVIDHNAGESSYNDLRLMSACRHVIASNSTFGWWAAWLGDGTADRMVVFPPHWLLAAGQDRDMVPDRWCRLAAKELASAGHQERKVNSVA